MTLVIQLRFIYLFILAHTLHHILDDDPDYWTVSDCIYSLTKSKWNSENTVRLTEWEPNILISVLPHKGTCDSSKQSN